MIRTLLRSVRSRSALLTVAVLVGLAGCSDGTGPASFAGTFDMDSFNGQKLPAGDGTLFIYSAVLVLHEDGTFVLDMERDFCTAGVCQPDRTHESGTYTVQGVYLSLLTSDGYSIEGRIHPGYITLLDGSPGSIWERRQ